MATRFLALALLAACRTGAQERAATENDTAPAVKTAAPAADSAAAREQLGIITVLTGEEIRRSGARDLMDALRLIPGVYFAMGADGTVGIGMRGNWGNDGRVLLLIDGHTMNENRYAGVAWDHHFPVDNIKRVEVIRGPGSSVYGGYAELGVINVVTRGGDDIDGVEVSGLLGFLGKGDWTGLTPTAAHKDVSFSAGKRIRDFEFSAFGYYGTGYRSDEEYVTLYPQRDDSGGIIVNPDGSPSPVTYAMNEEEESGITRAANVSAALRYRDLSARFMYDYYDAWALTDNPHLNAFYSTLAELAYRFELPGGRLAITPRYNLAHGLPSYRPGWYANLAVTRNAFNVTAAWTANDYVSVSGGADGYVDYVTYVDEEWDASEAVPSSRDDTLLFTGERSAAIYNAAFFLEGLFRIPRIGMSITAGGRYEYNDYEGHAFAPRLALTQVLREFHWEFQYSRASRPPGIGAIEERCGGGRIEAEKTDVFELGLGYRIGRHLHVAGSLFEITIHDPIVYREATDSAGYLNGERLGSRGVELGASLRYNRLNASFGYSYYTAGDKPESDEDMLYVVDMEGVSNAYCAAPQHKVTATFSANPWKGLHVSTNLLFLGPAYGNEGLDTVMIDDTAAGRTYVDVTTGVVEVDPALILNLYISYENFLVRGLTVGIGIYDLFDRSCPFVQAYNGWASPYPSYGREVAVRLTYALRSRR